MMVAMPVKYKEFMERSVPLWVFFLCLLLGGLFTIAFGWAVKSSLSGNDHTGMLGKAAVKIASFPTTTKEAFLEAYGYVSGNYRDDSIKVEQREIPDYSGFKPVPTAFGIDVQGILIRADLAAITVGWRLLIGAFTVGGEVENAALLLSPQLEIVKVWILEEKAVDGFEPRPKYRKFIHGVEYLDDGSLIFAFDSGVSLQRIDRCGERQWVIGGDFDHTVTLDDTGESIWTVGSERDTIFQVSVEDGQIIRQFSMYDIISKNPMIDIFEILRWHDNDIGTNSRNTAGTWMKEPFHLNDVDPLPAALANRFDGFSAGDLLISARSLNLLFVIDPDTLEVKWWRIGAVQRQHDPDWLPSGEISVLNNRMSRDFSEIVSIDPRSFQRKTLFDGRRNDFYTRIRGKHQVLPTGALIVTSSQQGRAFEVDRDGEVVLEIVNVKPGSEATNYVISELRWLPLDSVDLGDGRCAIAN